jgi:hypothetical protein
MKRNSLFVPFLFLLAALAGYLLSKASIVGRVGISLFYREYQFLKTWWQGGLVVFVVWMILFLLQGLVQRRKPAKVARLVHTAAILVALAGLVLTYQDFRHTTSHRWLGERFHLGGYLFWLGWIGISIFYLTNKKKTLPAVGFVAGTEKLPNTL